MNSRERLLTVFDHKIPDKVPWSGLVNDYFLNFHKGELGDMNASDFLKEAGADIFNWLGMKAKSPGVKVQTYNGGSLVETDESGNWLVEFYNYIGNIDYYKSNKNKTTTRKFITPLGELTVKFTYTPGSQTVFISEFPVKKIEDYRIFTYMIESLEYEDLSKYFADMENEIGGYGINAAVLHSTPVYELIQCFMGMESFHYFFFDYRRETLELINRIFKKFIQCYETYSKTCIPAIVIPEDASTTLYSPSFFDEYLSPVINEYCRIINNKDKISVIHACGHLDGLKESFSRINVDCIESVSPPPTGNVSVKEFKKALPGVCIMGGIPANCYLLEPDNFKKYIAELILENKDGGDFILSSGDSVPANAKIENIRSISDLIEKYGKY
ncbi:MAG: uroporphyrinogen decarboxylase family protein [Candidatus Humimicrobiaceae bacterium]